jgi:NADPH:quinone reductase-like Zn-dependent oxidoreductase
MKAAVVERYGPPEVVSIREVPPPTVGDGDILVRIIATTLTVADARVRALRVPPGLSLMMRLALGFRGPKKAILGVDCAGIVEAAGKDVTRYKIGDRVVGSSGFDSGGGHAESIALPAEGGVARIPDGVSFEDAVSVVFGASTALEFFRLGNLKAGESILINGASGAVGTMALQLAHHFGAEVTGVCSGKNMDLVRSLGADHVIDYEREDFTQNDTTYDVIMDNHGNAPYPRIKHLLNPGGRFLMVILANIREMVRRRPDIVTVTGNSAITAESYAEIMGWLAMGVLKPVIDSRYRFDQIVEAHRRVDTGHKVGSVIVRVGAE